MFLSRLLHAGKAPSPLLWDNKRIVIINFIILVSVPVFCFFTFLNFQNAQNIFAYVNIAIILLLVMTFIAFRIRTNIKYASSAILVALFATHITAMFQGGIANTGFFWFFFFPLFAILLKGHKAGSYWVLALLGSILLMFVFQDIYALELSYDPALLPILIIALSIEAVVALYVESVRLKYDQNLQEMNMALHDFNLNLEAKVTAEIQKNAQKDQLLQQQAKMAAMGEMTNYIAHQWKQPLATIAAIIQTLKVQKDLGTLKEDELSNEFEKINIQVAHMSQTMVDFNKFTRSNDEKEEFDLHKLILESTRIIEPLLQSKEIQLTLDMPTMRCNLYGQRNLLIHVLLNLINNAKDALLSRKSKEPEIKISINSTCTQIEVRDNAGGIDPSVEPFIFDAYFSTKGGGGIGLQMCKRIIEDNFQGSLELQNSSKGATFIIHLDSTQPVLKASFDE